MNYIPTVTICGSYKFLDMMHTVKDQLVNAGLIVLTPQKMEISDDAVTPDSICNDIEFVHAKHDKKVMMSDTIFVVDVNGYIGDNTMREIEFANKMNKPVFYLAKPEKFEVEDKYIGIENLLECLRIFQEVDFECLISRLTSEMTGIPS